MNDFIDHIMAAFLGVLALAIVVGIVIGVWAAAIDYDAYRSCVESGIPKHVCKNYDTKDMRIDLRQKP